MRIFLLLAFLFSITSVRAQFDCTPFGGSISCDFHTDPAANGHFNIFTRSIDGTNNNLFHPEYGAAHQPFLRKMSAHYDGDGNTMYEEVNARTVSNAVFDQSGSIPSAENLSALTFAFLQFLDHDITASGEGKTESSPIGVPLGDPLFDPFGTGGVEIPFMRSGVMPGTGTNAGRPRDQINEITAWVDGSGVYGSDHARAAWLRTGQHGKLKTSPGTDGPLLPCNTVDGNCQTQQLDPGAPRMAGDTDRCGQRVKVFVAGDVRANEQPTLLSLHTLFVREHNRLCEERVQQGHTDDEQNYQYARSMVSGMIQEISYGEVLPALGVQLPAYQGYKSNIKVGIWNVFATAAYRLGHTMVTPNLWMLDESCEDATARLGCGPGTAGVFGGASCLTGCLSEDRLSPLALRDAFFNPSIVANNGIDALLRGAGAQVQQDIDAKVIDDLRSFLFGAPGAGGLDLAALNIQRGRDHGLPKFNEVRQAFNLSPISIQQLTNDPQLRTALTELYGSADHIDAWVGMLAEKKAPNRAVGQTLQVILKRQFRRLRDGDRFYYRIDPGLNYADRLLVSQSSLAEIITRNTGVSGMENAFYAQPCTSAEYCTASGFTSYQEWIKRVQIRSDFNNKSNNDQGYGNYTHLNPTIMRGVPTQIRLTPGYLDYTYRESWRIWIDFDNDGEFHPQQEKVLQRRGRNRINTQITVPAHIPVGTYRMRIAMSGTGQYPSPCGQFSYGEVEDYSITVTDSPDDLRIAAPEIDEPEAETSLPLLTAYPNPTQDEVTLLFRSTRPRDGMQLVVTNLLGQTVLSRPLGAVRPGENLRDVSLGHLQPGIYILSIRGDGVEKRVKIKLTDRV